MKGQIFSTSAQSASTDSEIMDPSHSSCPFCPFSDSDPSFVAEHIDYCHPENGAEESAPHNLTSSGPSPQSDSEEPTGKYVDCPHGCGEIITTAELSTHLDLHVAEGIVLDESGSPLDAGSVLSDHDLYSDPEDSFKGVTSRKGEKRGLGRDFVNTKTSKPGRTQSPSGTMSPDGAKRLGVCSHL
jgi:hypothetical protein